VQPFDRKAIFEDVEKPTKCSNLKSACLEVASLMFLPFCAMLSRVCSPLVTQYILAKAPILDWLFAKNTVT
jgi:hypothetical protein